MVVETAQEDTMAPICGTAFSGQLEDRWEIQGRLDEESSQD
jgi:hypothetical protein